MTEMIERVARAICQSQGLEWDKQSDPMTSASGSDGEQDGFREMASAAIRAMREPTEQMSDYGLECLPESRHMTGPEDVLAMWHSMIDVATDSHG